MHHIPLCEDSDKIPEIGPLLIFSISLVRLNAEPGKKKSKYVTVYTHFSIAKSSELADPSSRRELTGRVMSAPPPGPTIRATGA
jgi:hypothetical protein